MSSVGLAELAVGVGGAGGIAAYWFAFIGSAAGRERASRREQARARRAYLAAVEAAEDDPSFSPEAVVRSILQVLPLAGQVWRAANATPLDNRPDRDLVRSWARARQDWLGGALRLRGN